MVAVRVAIVAECFLPEVNGVTNSVLRVVEHLERYGHQCLVIAPGPGPTSYRSAHVERVAGFSLPLYRSLSIGVPGRRIVRILRSFDPDVVHLAAPAVLGAAGARAARLLGIPAVAIYQTDIAGFARRYGLSSAGPAIWAWLRWVHQQTELTLAPSTLAAWELRSHGISPVRLWARGVDLDRFAPAHRSARWHSGVAPGGEVVVGYVGRLAKEKQVHLLGCLQHLPGCRLVVVGDGPARNSLERAMPGATFLGHLNGEGLSRALASIDVFVHTGADETFCQSLQEALASGVPVVAPASGGPLDLVRHGENGWLYPPGKPELLASAVGALVASPLLRRAMADRARASVSRRTWEVLGHELIGHYRSVVDGPFPIERVA